jgi:hypothetical protein
MKISKLLVLSALFATATSVKAEVPDGIWQMPEPQGLEFTTFSDEVDENGDAIHYYLYNPGAKMFFASGNSWNTQASVRTFGYPFWVTYSTEEDAPEGSYELWNYVNNADRTDVTGNHNLFTDDGGSTWVDHGSQGNYSWTFTIVGDFVRFQNVALIADVPDYAGKYIGWTGDYAGEKNSSILRMIAPDTEGTCIDWRAVTVASYEAFVADEAAYGAYTNGVECFFLAKQLRDLLVEGEEIGADIAGALAVYTNTSSTKAQLTQAIADAKEAIDKRKQELVDQGYDNATVENPVVVSDKFLKNYDFKGDDLTTGWKGTSFGSYGPKENAEHYNKTYDTYQDVNGGLHPGVYAVGVNAFYRAGNAQPAWDNYKAQNAQSKYAKVYAKVGATERESAIVSPCSALIPDGTQVVGAWSQCVDTDEDGNSTTYIIPNNMEGAEYAMHTMGLYANKVLVAVNADTDTLRLGVRKSAGVDGDWSIFDDFSLTYYGKGADACNLYLTEALKNFGEVSIEDGVLYTPAYLEAYKAKIQEEHVANSLDEVNEVLNGIEEAYKDLQKNMELWSDWQKLVAKIQAYTADSENDQFDTVGEMGDYLLEAGPDGEAVEDIIEDPRMTNEELEAEIAKLNDMIDRFNEEYKNKMEPGVAGNADRLLKNPGFDDDKDINYGGAEGWTVDRIDGGNVVRGPLGQGNKDLMESALGYMNYCFESWHCHKWDVWQEIQNAPAGLYELQVQGYVRCEVGGYNRGDELVDPYISPVYLYMNNALSQFPSVYSETPAELGHEFTTVESWTTEEINGNLYPNSMGGAAQCFAWDMYKTKAYGLIMKKGDPFRIGVKMDANQDWWCIFDNFHLTWYGYDPEYIRPALEEAIATINADQPMGKEQYNKAFALQTAAMEAIAGGDGETMFNVLSEIYDLQSSILESVSLFSQLQNANTGLYEAMWASTNDAARNEANTLFNRIDNGINDHEFEDADVPGLLEQIQMMITKLKIPAGVATDDDPIEYTDVIVNPNYDENANGWSGTGAAWSDSGYNAEIFGKNYDYYQDIMGLPAGTYRLDVQAFYRAGSAANDYNSYVANPDSLNYAFIYAQTIQGTDTVTYSVPMKRLAAEALVGDSFDGYVQVKNSTDEEEGLYVPNSMTTAGEVFAMDKDNGEPYYKNYGPVFKVQEGQKVRIGLKKGIDLTDNWTIFDNWQLWCFGTESSLNPSGDPSGINGVSDAQLVKVEFFTLDGRRAANAQKGLVIMKQTLGNGNIIVKKIQK